MIKSYNKFFKDPLRKSHKLVITYFSGSVIKRQERSIRDEGDIQTLDCAAIEKDRSKFKELFWKVKGSEVVIGYCNRNKCGTSKSFLEDKKIQVLGISKGTLSIKRTLPQKIPGQTVTFVCEVHTTDHDVRVSEAKIIYSLECKEDYTKNYNDN